MVRGIVGASVNIYRLNRFFKCVLNTGKTGRLTLRVYDLKLHLEIVSGMLYSDKRGE